MRLRTRMLGRLGPRSLLFLATCITAAGALAGASSAQAYSTTYLQGVSCLVIQQSPHVPNNTGYPLLQGLLDDSVPPQTVADIVTIPRPMQVANYKGTAGVYWIPVFRLVQNSTGQWAQALAPKYRAYASSRLWQASHGLLSYLWWNGVAPPGNIQLSIPTGYTLMVWGRTEWLNAKGQWFDRETRPLGSCDAS